MGSSCNKHVEKAGYGEKERDGIRMIYWIAH